MSITKNVLLISYSSMKKNQKVSDDFWCRKLTLKVKFWHFLTPPHCTNNFLWVCRFLDKNLSDVVHPVWILDNCYCHNVSRRCCSPSCNVLLKYTRTNQQISLGIIVLLMHLQCSYFCEMRFFHENSLAFEIEMLLQNWFHPIVTRWCSVALLLFDYAVLTHTGCTTLLPNSCIDSRLTP